MGQAMMTEHSHWLKGFRDQLSAGGAAQAQGQAQQEPPAAAAAAAR